MTMHKTTATVILAVLALPFAHAKRASAQELAVSAVWCS
jgi:hypothetical protein